MSIDYLNEDKIIALLKKTQAMVAEQPMFQVEHYKQSFIITNI